MTLSPAAAATLSIDQSNALAEFARACKSAARSVSLYPLTHPSIAASLSRVTASAKRLTASGTITLGIHPSGIIVEGRGPARPDGAIGELACLLHDRLVGELRITREAEPEDWHALLLILSRTPEELIQEGGVAKAWSASRRAHLDIREIDYAEVLRERAGGDAAAWDRIIACCLQGETSSLDERAMAALVAAVGSAERFGELLARLQASPAASGGGIGATAAALLQLMRTALEASAAQGADNGAAIETMSTAMAQLTPDLMLAVLAAKQDGGADAVIAGAVIDGMTDDTVASFVVNSVATDRGATERLAHAFEALVPEAERKQQLVDLAGDKARAAELGQDANFEQMWHTAADMLTSYSDKKYVSDDYARELSGARTRAVDVERVSDDPPERVHQWVESISDDAVRELDRNLLLDLLRIEDDPVRWNPVAAIVVAEVERRTLLGDLEAAAGLGEAVLRERQAGGRGLLAPVASALAEKLAAGPLIRHVVIQLRTAEDSGVAGAARICHALGAPAVRPLAEALAVEENGRAIRALREILLAFGADGRSSVEQLKTSTNPAVRRTAIDLLRVFGGDEALPELESILGDADPQVQRDAVRAILQIGTTKAYAVLQRALATDTTSRDAIVQQLISLRDQAAIPLLCHVLSNTPPSGALAAAHLQIIDALGSLSVHPESTRALQFVLHRSIWWAPARTARLREAAAAALVRIGSPETSAVLEEASRTGSRRVRKIARARVGGSTLRERKTA
jgi:HEAT repeat protein